MQGSSSCFRPLLFCHSTSQVCQLELLFHLHPLPVHADRCQTSHLRHTCTSPLLLSHPEAPSLLRHRARSSATPFYNHLPPACPPLRPCMLVFRSDQARLQQSKPISAFSTACKAVGFVPLLSTNTQVVSSCSIRGLCTHFNIDSLKWTALRLGRPDRLCLRFFARHQQECESRP